MRHDFACWLDECVHSSGWHIVETFVYHLISISIPGGVYRYKHTHSISYGSHAARFRFARLRHNTFMAVQHKKISSTDLENVSSGLSQRYHLAKQCVCSLSFTQHYRHACALTSLFLCVHAFMYYKVCISLTRALSRRFVITESSDHNVCIRIRI